MSDNPGTKPLNLAPIRDNVAVEWKQAPGGTVMVVNTLPIDLPLAELAAYCRHNGIIEMALFGSALREDFGPENDIDLLVTFSPEAGISLMDHVRLEEELSEIVGPLLI